MIRPHSLLTDPRTAPIFAVLPRTPKIIDIGPGIRPCPVFPCKEHICIEPHGEYCDILRGEWRPDDRTVRVWQADALLLEYCERASVTVLALDVIEHLPRDQGEALIKIAESFPQVVIFTPFGYVEQHGDAWGLNGGYWQRHRSGWMPEDFGGKWRVHCWPEWNRRKRTGAILAIHSER